MAFPAGIGTYPFDLNVQPNSGLTIPWREFISRAGSTFDASFGNDGSQVALVIDVYWDDLGQALQQCLGYSSRTVVPGDWSQLNRFLPMRHPRWPQLFCTRVAKVQGISFQGTAVVEQPGTTTSEYFLARLTLQFGRMPYALINDNDMENYLDDDDLPQEFQRFTDRNWVPSAEILAREQQQFSFVEGDANGNQFTGPFGMTIGKARLTRTWYSLPEDAVFNASEFPAGLMYGRDGTGGIDTAVQALGTVNASTFLGCPAGTLLYEAPEIIPRPLTLPPDLMDLPWQEYSIQLQYDVRFNFVFFDPPIGTGVTSRGHNLAPWAKDGRWYPIQTATGLTPFKTYEFKNLFRIL